MYVNVCSDCVIDVSVVVIGCVLRFGVVRMCGFMLKCVCVLSSVFMLVYLLLVVMLLIMLVVVLLVFLFLVMCMMIVMGLVCWLIVFSVWCSVFLVLVFLSVVMMLVRRIGVLSGKVVVLVLDVV